MEPEPLNVESGGWTGVIRFVEGDIVTFGGLYNRPATFSRAWWKCLLFGRIAGMRFVGLHLAIHKVCRRRDLLQPRALQKYRCTGPGCTGHIDG
jgi:hypothetical protein